MVKVMIKTEPRFDFGKGRIPWVDSDTGNIIDGRTRRRVKRRVFKVGYARRIKLFKRLISLKFPKGWATFDPEQPKKEYDYIDCLHIDLISVDRILCCLKRIYNVRPIFNDEGIFQSFSSSGEKYVRYEFPNPSQTMIDLSFPCPPRLAKDDKQ